MKQLDPKAVWVFFIRLAFIWLAPALFIGIFVILNGIYSQAARVGDAGVTAETVEAEINQVLLTSLGLSSIAFLVFVAVCFVWARLTYRFYKYELTEAGFRKELGVIYKKYVTIPYDRIQNVDIFRGILSRLLGLSDINIQTAGSGSGSYMGGFGARSMGAEGRLPAVSREVAEQLRDELIQRARQSRGTGQGL